MSMLDAERGVNISRSRFVGELLVAILLARMPVISLPFNWLESYFHEISHALMTVITGGEVSHLELLSNGAGYCYSVGGWPVLIGMSGYLGASLWGYLLYSLTQWPRGIRVSYTLLAFIIALSTLLWARDGLTMLILLCISAVFLLPLRFASASWLLTLLRVIGLVVMLNAILSPLVLLQVSAQGDGQLLAELTWVPSLVWVGLWCSVSVCCVYLCWHRIDKQASLTLK
ncbi:M50 family metallopeptidase [Shewanella sp. NIFS-20-20]|uniref:M50 family metallopeptidase n=1 Tax=Shewanella sp. NIFS-20-20 TaxID=2853806 RepID=UPI001C481033|nr:M50 family metallopeptidase [Shewanella sp. NIFS-20-20]MBV7314412.1 M50 family metallopeptidase [Shewanella sp. NIFS-20-20]